MAESQAPHTHVSFKTLFSGVKLRNHPMKLISLAFGLGLMSWLLAQLDFAETLRILRGVPIPLVIAGFLLYALSFYLRARRFRLLLPQDQQIRHIFPIVLVHYTALNIIPARLGELSYLYLLKTVNQVSPAYSVSSLILARVFDQIAISFLFLVSARFVHLASPWLNTLKWSVEGVLSVVCVSLILILTYKERCVAWIRKSGQRLGWDQRPIFQKIMRQLEEIAAAFQRIRTKREIAKVLGLSVAIWIGIFSVNYVLLAAFEVKLSYVEIVLASTLIILSALPLASLSFLGIHEITWTGLAVSFGVSKNVAIISAFGTHILSTLFLILFGALGLLRLANIRPPRPATIQTPAPEK